MECRTLHFSVQAKPTAQFSDIECCCEDKKAGFVAGLPSGEESSEPVILF